MPSLNTGNAILSNAIAVNSSYNVGIGGAASGSFKLEVTGTSNLTGALTGTSATFSGAFKVGTTTAPSSSAIIAVINQSANAGGLQLTSANNGGVAFIPSVGGGLATYIHSGAIGSETYTLVSSIASTGAATFSSSVTANSSGSLFNANTGGLSANILTIKGGGGSGAFGFRVEANNGDAIFRTNNYSYNVLMCENAGSVGIGTSAPANTLTIQNTGENAIEWHRSNVMQGMIGIPSASNQIIIGSALNDFCFRATTNMLFATGGETERMRITSEGNVLIGKTSTNVDTGDGVRFDANGSIFTSIVTGEASYYLRDITNSVYRFYVTSGGTINATNTTISAISDVRLKENISDLEIGLDAIMALRPRKFDWKKESGNSGKNIRGFIAQEFEEIFPDLIDESINPAPEGEEPYKQIRQDLIPILVKAMQQQQAQIEELNQKLNEQQQTINSLINR